jgi:hypothetical protein
VPLSDIRIIHPANAVSGAAHGIFWSELTRFLDVGTSAEAAEEPWLRLSQTLPQFWVSILGGRQRIALLVFAASIGLQTLSAFCAHARR